MRILIFENEVHKYIIIKKKKKFDEKNECENIFCTYCTCIKHVHVLDLYKSFDISS